MSKEKNILDLNSNLKCSRIFRIPPTVHAAIVTSSLEVGLLGETSGLMNLTFPLPQYCSPSRGFCPSTMADGSRSSMYPVLVPSHRAAPWVIRAVMSWSSPASMFLDNGNGRHMYVRIYARTWHHIGHHHIHCHQVICSTILTPNITQGFYKRV